MDEFQVQPIKNVNHIKNVQPTKSIQHMKNIQPIKKHSIY